MKDINKKELHSIFNGIINNNTDKFNELYNNYYFLVEAISFSILKNKEESQDITQEVFTKIYELPKAQLPTNNESTWIYSVTKNEALNYLKKNKDTINLDEVYCVAKDDEYINEVISKETYNKIISKLENIDQQIVSLKVLGDLSFREIAGILGIPIGTIQWRYYKAIHLIRTIFGNIVVFIITISLYITRKFSTNRNKVVENEIQREIENNETKNPEGELEREETIKKEQVTEQDSVSKNELDSIISNSITTNNINDINNLETNSISGINEVQINQPVRNNYDKINLLLIGISSITLIFNIILLIIFSKHQQKRSKKTSK